MERSRLTERRPFAALSLKNIDVTRSLKDKKKRFCLLRNSTGIAVEIKRHKVFVGRRQHRGDSLGQMDHGDVYIFSFLKDHYRKVLSRRCSPRRLLSLSKIQGSLEENKALEIILKSTAEM